MGWTVFAPTDPCAGAGGLADDRTTYSYRDHKPEMTEFANRALLPAGLRDVLPPDAAFETDIIGRLMAFFAANGYEHVKPPLIEFEEALLAGSGAAMAGQIFRVMDPISQRIMGVRADMTLQVARIATTRLAKAPRPLRLAYGGQVLRVKGSQLRPDRQFPQAGIEVIGAPGPEADAEVVLLAAEALAELGVTGISIDLNLPTLVPALCGVLNLSEPERTHLRRALDHKDVSAIAAIGGTAGSLLGTLLAAVGPADRAVAMLAAAPLPPAAAAQCEQLARVVELVRRDAPDLTLTVDPVEHRGFEYHAGVSFAIFARAAQSEVGRGGHYRAGDDAGEQATGATLFVDAVFDVLTRPKPRPRLLSPPGLPRAALRALQREGWVTVPALAPVPDLLAEAARMRCSHAWIAGEARPVTTQGELERG